VTRYSDETEKALSILWYSYGDDVVDVLKAHGTTDATLVRLYGGNVNLFRVRHMLENVCEGGWAPTKKLTASGSLDKHYTDHVLGQFEWGETFTKSVYLQKATTLSNRRDHTVELYYQMGYDTLVVYDRGLGEFVSITKDGLITTFFKPKIDPHYVDETIADRLIRLN
jgi:hypothetical protein